MENTTNIFSLEEKTDKIRSYFKTTNKNIFITYISKFYPLNEETIEKYKLKLNWYLLSQNSKIDWSNKLIKKYEDLWDWESLSTNKSLPWSVELIEEFYLKWDWELLSSNTHTQWNDNMIEKFYEKWDWKKFQTNTSIPWSQNFFSKYKNKFSFNTSYSFDISNFYFLNYDQDFIVSIANEIDWEGITNGDYYEWSLDFLEKYKDFWDWKKISLYIYDIDFNESFFDRYAHKINWEFLSGNLFLKWDVEILIKYKDLIDWSGISENVYILSHPDLISEIKYDVNLDWEKLSFNNYRDWNSELIEKFKYDWDWSWLSSNTSIPWSYELIKEFLSYWDIENLCYNSKVPWNKELIELVYNFVILNFNVNDHPYYNIIKVLCSSKNMKWTNDFIYKYKDILDWNYLLRNDSFRINDEIDPLIPDNTLQNLIYREDFVMTEEYIEKLKENWNPGYGYEEVEENIFREYNIKKTEVDGYLKVLDWIYISEKVVFQDFDTFYKKYKKYINLSYLLSNKNIQLSDEFIDQNYLNFNGRSYEKNWLWMGLSTSPAINWNLETLEKYKEYWYWDELSTNIFIEWNENIIDRYIDKWNWIALCKNSQISWTEELIDKYIDYIQWETLSLNTNVRWSTELIEKYKMNWYWNDLSSNTSIPWSVNLLESYIEKWDWSKLSANLGLPWSDTLIENYQEKWNWEKLSANTNLPLTKTTIQKYQQKWDWYSLSENISFPTTIDILELFEKKINWYSLLNNKNLVLSIDYLNKFISKWKVDQIFSEKHTYNSSEKFFVNIEWSEEVLKFFLDIFTEVKDKIFYPLSDNRGLAVNLKTINEYKKYWNWELLSENINLPWNEDLIDSFVEYWDWMNLSSNPGLPWDENFIEKYKDKWNWMNIAGNTTLPWNEQLIEKFKSELEGQMYYGMYSLSNRHSKVSNETELFVTKNKTNYQEYHILRLIQRKILNNTVRINNNKSIHITNKDELLINSLIEVLKNEKDWKVIGFFVANERTNLWDLSFNRSLLCDYIDLNLIDEILN